MGMLRARLASKYIFVELLPGFFIGVVVFISILLMFQVLRLTEFVLVHGVDLKTAFKIVSFLTISFLPAVLPMSLLFAVLLTFSRFSGDSEIVAFKSVGLHLGHLIVAPIILGLIVAAFSAHTSFYSAPWGNRQFEVLITKLGNAKAAATIREGTFSEGFFDLVVYSQSVDTKSNFLKKVFIYDERDPQNPITIIAKAGQIVPSSSPDKIGAMLRLSDGNIHRTSKDSYTKINFDSYDLNLVRPINEVYAEKSMLSMTLDELTQKIKVEENPEKKRSLASEFHKRWAISVACILFAILGVGLGTVTHKRNVRSGSLIMSLAVIITYWGMYVVGDNLARAGTVHPLLSIWFANFFFSGMAIWLFRRAST